LSEEEDGLEGLHSKDFGLQVLNGATVDLDHTSASLAVSNGGGVLLSAKDLDRLDIRHGFVKTKGGL
jgi:hypothetical protein